MINESMRYLGWKQPYAELMLFGKQETRTWYTKYRGLVLITASKTSYKSHQVLSISGINQFRRIQRILERIGDKISNNRGHAIAVGRLVACEPMKQEDEDSCFVQHRSGLWVHYYENVKPIKPIPFKGAQGWRNLTPEFINTIEFI